MRFLMLAAVLVWGGQAGATCIRDNEVESTERPNDTTLIFHMMDKSVWRNTLPVRCANLSLSVQGFTIEPTDPDTSDICDGMAVIHLNDVGHASCILGKFSEIKAGR